MRVWDSRTGRLVCELLQKHAENVTSAIFSHDDSKLLTLSTDKQLILWDIKPAAEVSSNDLDMNEEQRELAYVAVEVTRVETRC